MDQDLRTAPYQGIPPADARIGATAAFIAMVTPLNWAIMIPIRFASDKLFSNIPFTENAVKRLRMPFDWLTGAAIVVITLIHANKQGLIAREKAELAQQQHDALLADNIAMRSQLNQTGQILKHVAGQLENGEMKDSTLTLNEAAPPSHVAKLEAARAEQAYHQAATHAPHAEPTAAQHAAADHATSAQHPDPQTHTTHVDHATAHHAHATQETQHSSHTEKLAAEKSASAETSLAV